MAKTRKIIVMWVMIIISLLVFAGCGGNKLSYNAVMYGDIYENRKWLHDDFYEANLTRGGWSDEKNEYINDDAYPLERTKIITDSVEFNKVFKDFPKAVDFEKTMILMSCFTTASSGTYEIKSIFVDEQALIIRYKHPASKKKEPPSGSQPLTKWVIVVMDKLDIATAEFIFGS